MLVKIFKGEDQCGVLPRSGFVESTSRGYRVVKDYEVTLTLKNNRLLTMMRDRGIWNAAELSRIWGQDFEDLKGITKQEDWEEGKAQIVICEGCGPIQVNPAGECVSEDCGVPGHNKPWVIQAVVTERGGA